MKAEIITIGSELLLGQIIDTNSSSIAKRLAENGIELLRTTTVGDEIRGMVDLIREATARSQIVITTGGIGPTEDDLTREAVAEAFLRPLTFQANLLKQIEDLMEKRGFRMHESNRKQAYIPEGAIPVENPKGTAPGFILEHSNGSIISLPGVPREMEYLMEATVIPYLRKRFHLEHQIIKYKVLRVCGLGESVIGHQINDLMKGNQNPLVGTLASMGDIKIRITAKGETPEEASALIQKMEQEVRERLGVLIFGVDDETLQGNLTKELEKLNLTLSVVETFTGGILSQKLTGTDSPSFIQGVIFFTEESQRNFLQLSPEEMNSLKEKVCALADSLAQKAGKSFHTDLSLAVLGKVMKGQNENEYRADICCSLSTNSGIEHQENIIGGELWTMRERVSVIALDMMRKYLLQKGIGG